MLCRRSSRDSQHDPKMMPKWTPESTTNWSTIFAKMDAKHILASLFDRFWSQDGSKLVRGFRGWRLLGRLWRAKSPSTPKSDPTALPKCPQEPKTTPKMTPNMQKMAPKVPPEWPSGLREAFKLIQGQGSGFPKVCPKRKLITAVG